MKYKIGKYIIDAASPMKAIDAIKMIRRYNKQHNKDSKVKDEAFDRSTIEALISDEQAAIDAYNVAIANLDGKLSDLAIKVLQKIRDDEQRHVENLNAILSNNITEKNLEDSLGSDIDKYQQWVDYDMKRYGKISDKTNDEIRKAGLKIVKDKYGDYQVIA